MVSTCTTILLTVIQVLVASSGIALVVLGSLNLDNCTAEESLPIWMIAAGSTLLLLTLICLVYAFCSCCRNKKNDDDENHYYSKVPSNSTGFGSTLLALGCAFILGGLGVLLLLVWLALWVAGSYFVAAAGDAMRVESLVPEPHEKETCDVASVAVSITAVCLVWALFFASLVWAACALISKASSSPAASSSQRMQHGYHQKRRQDNIYDIVADDDFR